MTSSRSLATAHVPAGHGPVTWFNSDVYRVPLTADQTGGALGMVEAIVPPGGGPPRHIHERADETFYVLSGEVDFTLGERTFRIHPEDVVFVPRGTPHGFHNPGIRPAELLFMYTPGGIEGVFAEGGDEVTPGIQMPPWGPERIDDRMLALWEKYDTVVPPRP